MTDNNDSPTQHHGVEKKKRIARLIGIIAAILAVLVVSGIFLNKWESSLTGKTAPASGNFDGVSEHWDQSQVPVSLQCGACHEKEFREWAASDHAWAFRKLSPQWDAEPFQNVKVNAHGSILTFQTDRNNQRTVHDRNSDKTWSAKWAVGRTPLVQYLVQADDGGYHTLSTAWDINKKEWFDIFGQEERNTSDWGHWTGRGMNWNSQCAWCHMSLFKKNYDSKTDKYASTWKEPGVTCIQCHGPVSAQPDPATGCMIPVNHRKLTAQQMKDNCATCHARRDELDEDFKAGDLFDDHFRLVLPIQPGIFWPNGMQRDEDYSETGLRLSKMGKAGVSCLDCHDPHTAALKLPQEDNSLCLRCHGTGEKVNGIAAPLIDMAKHSPCPPQSKGGRCVECHMPESLFMARDPRRDHLFNSPDPLLSVELGIPNACTMCHTDKDDQWAAAQVEKYYGANPKMAAYRERTRAVQWAYEGNPKAFEALLKLAKSEEIPGWKATILGLLDSWADNPDVQAVAQESLNDKDPLVRAYAVRLLGNAGNANLSRMLRDPVKLVRLEAAWAMKAILKPDNHAFEELKASAMHQADQPSGVMRMAQIESDRGNNEAAEQWYQKAIKWDSSSSVVYRDYAVFLSSTGQKDKAFEMIQKATQILPNDPDLWFLQGLGAIEANRPDEALQSFTHAIKLDSRFLRAYYNRALLYRSTGLTKQALADMQKCLELDTANPELPYTKAIIYLEAGDVDNAIQSAAEALRRDSSFQPARILLQQTMNKR